MCPSRTNGPLDTPRDLSTHPPSPCVSICLHVATRTPPLFAAVETPTESAQALTHPRRLTQLMSASSPRLRCSDTAAPCVAKRIHPSKRFAIISSKTAPSRRELNLCNSWATRATSARRGRQGVRFSLGGVARLVVPSQLCLVFARDLWEVEVIVESRR